LKDIAEGDGYGPVLYKRFSRGLWGKILIRLKEEEGKVFKEVIIESTTMKVHRHGGGQNGGSRPREESCGNKHDVSRGDNQRLEAC
jgi:hypothetical protein